jgi:hypothetical protein
VLRAESGFAEPLLCLLGASSTESLDINGYEGASILHDLNEPLPAELHARFSVVIDGGTLEHVFNYPAALRCALDAVRLGGHLIVITPINGYVGHGFYQFSPELFYRVLTPANGFQTVCMLIKPPFWRSRWRSVPDPVAVGGRVVWRCAWPTLLYVLAKRVAVVPVLSRPTMQSDYIPVWDAPRSATAGAHPISGVTEFRSRMPLALKEIRESAAIWRASRRQLAVVTLSRLRCPDPPVARD